MALWLNRSGRHCEHEDKFLKDNRIYLTWSGLKCDLGKLKDRKDLMAVLEEAYPNVTQGHRVQNLGQIWCFTQKMAPGDWVCTPSKRKTIHIGEISGPYTFDPSAESPYTRADGLCQTLEVARFDADEKLTEVFSSDYWAGIGL